MNEKEVVVCVYNGILFSHEKEGNPVIYNNINVPWGHYAQWDKSNRERQISYDITYMWNLKYDTNEPIYETATESQRTHL